MQALRATLQFILGIVLPLSLQMIDRRRLREDRRAGAWNGVSWAAALYAFGPLSMIGWVVVTRHDWAGWRRHGRLYAFIRCFVLAAIGALIALGIAWAIVSVDEAVDALTSPAAP